MKLIIYMLTNHMSFGALTLLVGLLSL